MAQRPNETQKWLRHKITFNERDTNLGPGAPDVVHTLEFNIKEATWPGGREDMTETLQVELDFVPHPIWELEKMFGKGWVTTMMTQMRRDAKDIGR